jgi:hypothetical protein
MKPSLISWALSFPPSGRVLRFFNTRGGDMRYPKEMYGSVLSREARRYQQSKDRGWPGKPVWAAKYHTIEEALATMVEVIERNEACYGREAVDTTLAECIRLHLRYLQDHK